jgi:hypothetical protein
MAKPVGPPLADETDEFAEDDTQDASRRRRNDKCRRPTRVILIAGSRPTIRSARSLPTRAVDCCAPSGAGSALLGGISHPSGDLPFEPMNQGTHPGELPAAVLDDVASVVGAEVPRAHPAHLGETLRAERVVAHMRRRGYPTPAWLGVGATGTHVWHLTDFVDAAPCQS